MEHLAESTLTLFMGVRRLSPSGSALLTDVYVTFMAVSNHDCGAGSRQIETAYRPGYNSADYRNGRPGKTPSLVVHAMQGKLDYGFTDVSRTSYTKEFSCT